MKNPRRVPIYRNIWSQIRHWQYLTETSDKALADSLELRNVRTLKDYDTDPRNITLSRIDRFLFVNNLTLQQLISFGTDM